MDITNLSMADVLLMALGLYIFIFTRVKDFRKLMQSTLAALAVSVAGLLIIFLASGTYSLTQTILIFLVAQLVFFAAVCFNDVIVILDEFIFLTDIMLLLYVMYAFDARMFFVMLLLIPYAIYVIMREKPLGRTLILVSYIIHSFFIGYLSLYQILNIEDMGMLSYISLGFLSSFAVTSILSILAVLNEMGDKKRDYYLKSLIGKFSLKQYTPAFLFVISALVLTILFLNHFLYLVMPIVLVNWIVIAGYLYISFRIPEGRIEKLRG